jgi:hypothetical protein
MVGVSIASFAVGIAFLSIGIYVYRGPNLDRMRRYFYFSFAPGALFSLIPFGIGFVIFGFFPIIPDPNWQFVDLMVLGFFVLVGVVLWTWSPSWTRPYWMRDELDR